MRSGKTAKEYGAGNAPHTRELLRRRFGSIRSPPLGVVFGTGQLATRFFYASTGEGLREICIEARHAQKILGEPLNKTDANGAEGLAKLAETGFYKVSGAPIPPI